jgi:ribonuclease-3
MLNRWFKKINSLLFTGGNFSLKISAVIGFKPNNTALYQMAFTHSSMAIELNGQRYNNERLEFLGDAILGAIVADYLFQKYPNEEEGFLTHLRSKIVSRKNLNKLALKLGLNHIVEFNNTGASTPNSIFGDAFEALIGALYLDLGYGKCKRFIETRILEELLNIEKLNKEIASHKSALLEWAAKNKHALFFKLEAESGESHARRYEISLWVNGQQCSSGQASSKKRAEEDAAEKGYKALVLENGQSQT